MAFSKNMVKEWDKDLSVEELERKLEETKKDFCFNSKEEQIKYIIDKHLYPSTQSNSNSRKAAYEEMLLEKTGKDYSYEPKAFDITLNDVVEYIINEKSDIAGIESIKNFFQKVSEVSENDMAFLLITIVQEEKMLNDFVKESVDLENANEICKKYYQIAKEYYIHNRKIG